MIKKDIVTYDRLKSLFTYDPDVGVFINTVGRGTSAKAGHEAGGANNAGYINITIDGKRYKAHRLVFLYMDGYIPEDGLDVDHINRIPHDNRYSNLRVVSKSCNMRNVGVKSNNTSGVIGLSFDKKQQKYESYIYVNKKRKFLGIYKIFKDAVLARWHAEIKHGWDNCCTESTAYNYLKENGYILSEWERS